MICVYLTYPFASASPNRWVCLCCLANGAHCQLYQRTLLSVWQHCRDRQQRRRERDRYKEERKKEDKRVREGQKQRGIKRDTKREFQGTRFYCIISCSWFSAVMFCLTWSSLKPFHRLKGRTRTACLTLLSLHWLLQQKFSHTLPVFQQLLRAFPQGVHKVGCMLMELHTQTHAERNTVHG